MRKVLSAYCLCIAILMICCMCVIAVDGIGAISHGQHFLLPELGFSNYKVSPNPDQYLNEATDYYSQIYQNGYNRSSFIHRFVSIIPSLAITNMLLFLIPTDCSARPSNKIMISVATCGLISLFLAIALRICMHNSYGEIETREIYPLAYMFYHLNSFISH